MLTFRNGKIREKMLWLKSAQHLTCFRSREIEKKNRGLQNISPGKGFSSTVNIIIFSKIFAVSAAIALLSDNGDNIFVQKREKKNPSLDRNTKKLKKHHLPRSYKNLLLCSTKV